MLTAAAVVTLAGAATDGLRALLFGWGHLQEGVIYFADPILAIHRGKGFLMNKVRHIWMFFADNSSNCKVY